MAENFKVLGVYKNGRHPSTLNPFQEKNESI
jgi:prephenate dehydratase